MALHWALSSTCLHLLQWGAQNWTRCGLTTAEERVGITFLDLLVKRCLMRPRIPFTFFTAWVQGWLMFHSVSPGPPESFLPSCFQLGGPQACTGAWRSSPHAALWTSLAELNEVPVGLFHQPVKAPLNGPSRYANNYYSKNDWEYAVTSAQVLEASSLAIHQHMYEHNYLFILCIWIHILPISFCGSSESFHNFKGY